MQSFHLTNSKNKRKMDVPNRRKEEVINQGELGIGKWEDVKMRRRRDGKTE